MPRGGSACVDFAETAKGAPEAIIGSAIGRSPHRKWLDFVSLNGKSEFASDLWALGIPLVSRLRPKQASALRLVTRVLGLPLVAAREHKSLGLLYGAGDKSC